MTGDPSTTLTYKGKPLEIFGVRGRHGQLFEYAATADDLGLFTGREEADAD